MKAVFALLHSALFWWYTFQSTQNIYVLLLETTEKLNQL